MTTLEDPDVKSDLLRRLRRIEGQVRGVSRMIEEGRDCHEVLQQLAAVRSATHQTSLQLMRSFASQCVRAAEDSPDQVVDALIQALSRVS